jgi:hypothetical protein
LSEVDFTVGILDTLLRPRAETPTYIPVVPAVMPIWYRSIERSTSLVEDMPSSVCPSAFAVLGYSTWVMFDARPPTKSLCQNVEAMFLVRTAQIFES